jgi:6-phosphofructokinase
MAFLKISELRPAGSELFQDSESYLNELNEQEISATIGGDGSDINISVLSQNSVTQGISIKSVSVVTEVKSPASIVFGGKKWY